MVEGESVGVKRSVGPVSWLTRPWRGCAKKCRLPGRGLVKEKKRY